MLSNPYCVALGGRRRGDIERVPKNHAYKDEESSDFRDRRHGGNRRVLSREEYRDFGKIPQEDGDYRTTEYEEFVSNCDVSDDDDLDEESLIPDADYMHSIMREHTSGLGGRGVIGRRAVRNEIETRRADSMSKDKYQCLFFLHGVSEANSRWIDQRERELNMRVKLDESNLRKFDRNTTPDLINDVIGTSPESVAQFVELTAQRRVVLCRNLEESKMKVVRLLDTVSGETFTEILRRRVQSDSLLIRKFDSVTAWIDLKKQELNQRVLSCERNLRDIDSHVTPELMHDTVGTSRSISQLAKLTAERRVGVSQKLKTSRKELSRFLRDAENETMSGIFIRQIPADELAAHELNVDVVASSCELKQRMHYKSSLSKLIKSNDRLLLDGKNLINFERGVTEQSNHDVKSTAERRIVLRQKCVESEIEVQTLKGITKRAGHRLDLVRAAIMSKDTLLKVEDITRKHGIAILVGIGAAERANRSS